jgi:hypothetical protein
LVCTFMRFLPGFSFIADHKPDRRARQHEDCGRRLRSGPRSGKPMPGWLWLILY